MTLLADFGVLQLGPGRAAGVIEAMLWTMAQPLLATQLAAPPQPTGNASHEHVPHGTYRCAGEDAWLGVAVTQQEHWRALCGIVPALAGMAALGPQGRRQQSAAIDTALAAWALSYPASDAAAALMRANVPAAALATSKNLIDSAHLHAREFWHQHGPGLLPGLPWRSSFMHRSGSAPGLGEHTEQILTDVLGLSGDQVASLRRSGALG